MAVVIMGSRKTVCEVQSLVIIKVVASHKAHPWHKYLSKHLGCSKLQMDLANDLINWGISMD
jgi:hypothetical protein